MKHCKFLNGHIENNYECYLVPYFGFADLRRKRPDLLKRVTGYTIYNQYNIQLKYVLN